MKQNNSQLNLADRFQVMAAGGRNLSEFCELYGLDLDAYCKPLGLDTNEFDDFQKRISLGKFCKLLDVLSVMSGDETFGIKYGQFFDIGALGSFGFGWSHAPTFKDALNFGIKFTRIAVDVEKVDLTFESDCAVLEWTYSPLITRLDQYVDCASTVLLRQLQNAAGIKFKLQSAGFVRNAPKDKSLYRSVFSDVMRFGQGKNVFKFSNDLLALENPKADRILHELMEAQCREILAALDERWDIVARLKRDFADHMEFNDHAISDVATRLGLSERTLQRRLSENGTTFWEVFESVKDEISSKLISETDLPLSEVARKTGYSTQSAYNRFVKRQHGKSPGELRKQAAHNSLT